MPVVFVTGSSRGIGFGIAKKFAQNGYKTVLNGCNDRHMLNTAVRELNSAHGGVMGVFADMSDYAQANGAINEIDAAFGPVDVLINNAGVASFGLFTDASPKIIAEIINANLHTTINASHLVLPQMVRRKAGSIINITSIWGVCGASCEVVYSTAKAGVIGLTKSLAKEVGPSGVRINAIACGAFETRMNDRLTLEEKADFVAEIPLGRFGMPHEVGDLALFLASNQAEYLTGQIINLDGGVL